MFDLNVEYVYCVIFSELFSQYCNFGKPLLVEVPQIPPIQSNPIKLPSEISPTSRINPTCEIKHNSEITSSTSEIIRTSEIINPLTTLIARKFWDSREFQLEVACHDFYRWSCPAPGHITLPVLGTLIELHIPATIGRSGVSSCETVIIYSSASLCPLSFLDTKLFPLLLPLLDNLHILWELSLTAEPLVVQAPFPAQCSANVQAHTSLIHTLRFVANYRTW